MTNNQSISAAPLFEKEKELQEWIKKEEEALQAFIKTKETALNNAKDQLKSVQYSLGIIQDAHGKEDHKTEFKVFINQKPQKSDALILDLIRSERTIRLKDLYASYKEMGGNLEYTSLSLRMKKLCEEGKIQKIGHGLYQNKND